ncbi:hypothetical protein OBBRIDRAFT_806891 [Obba rivulosa]|uniref:Uncharacterized protein n=1 Tax=Obba rivulosa TaxID=1052685 RepID=A0A8E2AKK3_9APHY|nr:hypothetical protein OBBRIDRAFT_806891 [Obba rivulosa]
MRPPVHCDTDLGTSHTVDKAYRLAHAQASSIFQVVDAQRAADAVDYLTSCCTASDGDLTTVLSPSGRELCRKLHERLLSQRHSSRRMYQIYLHGGSVMIHGTVFLLVVAPRDGVLAGFLPSKCGVGQLVPATSPYRYRIGEAAYHTSQDPGELAFLFSGKECSIRNHWYSFARLFHLVQQNRCNKRENRVLHKERSCPERWIARVESTGRRRGGVQFVSGDV